MTTFLTPQQLAGRISAAVDAAVAAAGRELGLTVTDPTVLHDVFSAVVHLAPPSEAVFDRCASGGENSVRYGSSEGKA